jgi:hypothetical protein
VNQSQIRNLLQTPQNTPHCNNSKPCLGRLEMGWPVARAARLQPCEDPRHALSLYSDWPVNRAGRWRTCSPAIAPASLVAWRWASLK